MSFFVMRTLSFLPGPIILGAVIDGKCTLWGYDKCGQRQNCLDYDVDALSWNIVLFGVITSGTIIFTHNLKLFKVDICRPFFLEK